MISPEESFHSYLRREVANAGNRYERARQRVFALSGGMEIEPSPALLQATATLAEELKVYTSTLRRLAHYAAHKAQPEPKRALAAHAQSA